MISQTCKKQTASLTSFSYLPATPAASCGCGEASNPSATAASCGDSCQQPHAATAQAASCCCCRSWAAAGAPSQTDSHRPERVCPSVCCPTRQPAGSWTDSPRSAHSDSQVYARTAGHCQSCAAAAPADHGSSSCAATAASFQLQWASHKVTSTAGLTTNISKSLSGYSRSLQPDDCLKI